MFRRDTIRYGNVWVRALCCLWVAITVANGVHFKAFEAWEGLARALVLGSLAGIGANHIRPGWEIALVFGVCLPPSILRFDRPIAMVVCGALFVGAYLAFAVGAGAAFEVVFPLVSPVLGIVGATAVLETMAWSEERTKRRRLEVLEDAKQQFTDMLVHDLRRRVSSILMSFSLLEKKMGKHDAKMQEIADTIRVTAERVVNEIGDLLDIRRIEEGKMPLQCERIDLIRLMREIAEEHGPAGALVGVRITLVSDAPVELDVDSNVLRRVLANLVWNALHHTPEGGRIDIGYARTTDGGMAFFVANTGRPISAERQAILFEAFASGDVDGSSRAAPGTGLGLAFCKLAMEAHGGSIAMESPWSEQGDGVKVTGFLPRTRVLQS